MRNILPGDVTLADKVLIYLKQLVCSTMLYAELKVLAFTRGKNEMSISDAVIPEKLQIQESTLTELLVM